MRFEDETVRGAVAKALGNRNKQRPPWNSRALAECQEVARRFLESERELNDQLRILHALQRQLDQITIRNVNRGFDVLGGAVIKLGIKKLDDAIRLVRELNSVARGGGLLLVAMGLIWRAADIRDDIQDFIDRWSSIPEDIRTHNRVMPQARELFARVQRLNNEYERYYNQYARLQCDRVVEEDDTLGIDRPFY